MNQDLGPSVGAPRGASRIVAVMDFTCGNCEHGFRLRPKPYENVGCPFCGALCLRTPLSDELDYETQEEGDKE